MRKKICFVVSTPFTAYCFLRDHISLLSKYFDVYLVANIDESNKSELDCFSLSEYKHIPIYRNIAIEKDINAVRLLTQYFKEKQFDAIHSVTPKAGLISALAGKLAGVDNRIHIFTGQVWCNDKGFRKLLLKSIDKIIASLSTRILVDGESQREFLIENGIIEYDNSQVLGKGSISGVNIQRFHPSEDIRKNMRKEFQLDDSQVVFTFLGRMNADKGMNELFSAFDLLAKEYKHVTLLLIGPDEEGWTKRITEYSNIKEGINYIYFGATSSPERILQAADVFCLPSYREGFGTSVIEAACLGLPVICSNAYGLRDTLVDGETGLRHRVKDSLDLYAQMKNLVVDRDQRLKMGENGRKYVLENFTTEQISKEWLGFYLNLLDVN